MNTKTILRHTAVLLSLGLTMTACADDDYPRYNFDEGDSGDMEDAGDDEWDDDGADESGGDEPGDDEPGDDEPGDDEPGDDEPGDDEPGDDEPGDDGPGDDVPSPMCGDGVVDAELGEQCDDGNANEIDGCQTNCQFGPSGLSIDYGAESSLGSYGGGGGSGFSEECDEGEVVIGMRGRSGSRIDRVQPQCGRVFLESSGPGLIEVRVEHSEFLGQHGGGGGTGFHLECGTDEVVVGFNGRSGAELDRLGLRCAPLTLVSNLETGALLISHGAIDPTYEVGGSGGSSFSSTCSAGQVVTKVDGRSGSRVDRLGMACRTLQVI